MNLFIVVIRFFMGLCIAIWNGTVGIGNILIDGHNKKVIEENNRINRGVIEKNRMSVADVFDDGCIKNGIVSGSENLVRAELIAELVKYCDSLNEPMVILHESDQELEKAISSSIGNIAVTINYLNPCFDPFYNLSDEEIVQIVTETAKKSYGANDNVRYCINGMLGCLRAIGRTPSLKNFATCPYGDLYEKVDYLISSGKINHNVGYQIKSDLMKGQKEFIKLKSYFSDLLYQAKHIITSSQNTIVYDVIRTINERRIVVIDVGSSLNTLLIDVILATLKIAISKTIVNVVLDDITINPNHESLRTFICTKNKRCTITLSNSDLYATTCSDEKVFYTIIGNSNKNIIMHHDSGVSADKWSKAIGYYDKTESSYTYTKGKTQGGISLFPSYNLDETINYSTKREEIVKSEQIQRMQNNEVYMFDRKKNQLIHTFIFKY